MARAISSLPTPDSPSTSTLAGVSGFQIHFSSKDISTPADQPDVLIVEGLNALPGVSCRMPGGAFYAFPNITGTGMDAGTLQRRMLEEAGVAVIAGTSFGAYGEGYLRFSYANSVDNIEQALERVARLLQG